MYSLEVINAVVGTLVLTSPLLINSISQPKGFILVSDHEILTDVAVRSENLIENGILHDCPFMCRQNIMKTRLIFKYRNPYLFKLLFIPNSKINQFFQNYGFYKIFNSKAVKLK